MDYDPPPPSGPPPNRVKSLERAVERPGAVRAAPKEVAPVEAPPCEFVRGKRFGRAEVTAMLGLGARPGDDEDREPPEPNPVPRDADFKNWRGGAGDATGQQGVAAWARMRPLTNVERKNGSSALPGAATAPVELGDQACALTTSEGCSLAGFEGVLGGEAVNADVFAHAFERCARTAAAGGSATLFAYGYTGSGKTHTVLGYGGEMGLHALATQDVLTELERLCASQCAQPEDALFLAATAIEVYGETVFDLMGATKEECALKVDAHGRTRVVLLQSHRAELGDKLSGLDLVQGGERGTVAARTAPLRYAVVRTMSDLDTVRDTALSKRNVGTSTEHAQSSRSHAVLRMDVVSLAALAAEDAFGEAQSLIAPLSNAVTNAVQQYYAELVDSDSFRQEDSKCGLKDYGGSERDAANEWLARKSKLDHTLAKLKAALLDARRAVVDTATELKAARVRAGPSCGGALILVDLAGADYDARGGGDAASKAAHKESIAINESLLALKECLRSVAKVPGAAPRPPFRQSKLTRILEQALVAPAARPTARATQASPRDKRATVMLINVAPTAHLEKRTTASLRYGQLFSGAKSKSTRRPQQSSIPQRSKFQRPAPPDAPKQSLEQTLTDLRAIYAKYSPDSDVDKILTTFTGREAELLGKVKKKYVN